MDTSEMKLANDLELTWELEVRVLRRVDGKPVYVDETINIPRMSTSYMIRYREALVREFGPILMAPTEKDKKTAIVNHNMTPERMGELLVNLLCPGLLDRLHPDSFDKLTTAIMEVEDDVLNPPEKKAKKEGKRKRKKSTKATRKRS
jgi:hypothetical protein